MQALGQSPNIWPPLQVDCFHGKHEANVSALQPEHLLHASTYCRIWEGVCTSGMEDVFLMLRKQHRQQAGNYLLV